MLRTALYLSFSSDNQREESIEGQRREGTDYTKRVGLDIVKEYVDRAQSAKTSVAKGKFQWRYGIGERFEYSAMRITIWR